EAMVNAGLNTVAKILTATPKQLSRVEGFAERKTQNIINGLRELVKSVPLALLMKASNSFADQTLGFGKERFEPIIQKLGRKTVLTGKINPQQMRMQMLQIPGIGERVADQFIDGLPEFREFYRELTGIVTLAKDQKAGKLTGKTFVFTNFRDDLLEKLIESNGGKIGGSVTNATTVLFAASLNTGKAIAAAERGIKVIMQNQAKDHLNKMLKG
ncbi:MAG TPA: BRCT domain-containing protein, partial [Nitrosopumilaceae archaeon]|nr:BRCT domain-containing protein [Nitrosopumilaceae archaeon]